VIHYHLPDDIENYTHRSGRTARAGKKGVSFTLLNMREAYRLKEIEKLTGVKFKRILIPSATEVRDKKLLAFLQTIEKTEIEEGIFDDQVMNALEELDNFTKVDLIKKVLSLELRRFSNEYLTGPDLNAVERGAKDADGSGYKNAPGTKRLFVSVGSKDGLDNNTLKDLVVNTSGVPFKAVHRVEVKGVYSFMNVDDEYVEQLVQAVHGTTYKDRPVRIEVSGDKPEGEGRGGRRSYGGGGYAGCKSSDRSDRPRNRSYGDRGGERRGGSDDRRSSGSGYSNDRSYSGGVGGRRRESTYSGKKKKY
jgi:ATP-dependent RNA helicase DeaD